MVPDFDAAQTFIVQTQVCDLKIKVIWHINTGRTGYHSYRV